jgi:hypothetical protein
VATIVARYNVLESMYHNWPGMTLEASHELSLLVLCMHVLRYVDFMLAGHSDFEGSKVLMANIRKADVICRGFTVTIVSAEESKVRGSKVLDISSDDDDDSTEFGSDATMLDLPVELH